MTSRFKIKSYNDILTINVPTLTIGGRAVGPIPIACSLATTFFSAVTVLGTPVEYYQYGTMFTYFLITYLFCSILIAELFGPLYHDLNITSTYEYLEARFSRSVRLHISFVFVVQNLIYIAIVIYGPALALETTTGKILTAFKLMNPNPF